MRKLLVITDLEGCIGHDQCNSIDDLVPDRIDEIKRLIDHLKNRYSLCVVDGHNDGKQFRGLKSLYPEVEFVEQIWRFSKYEEYSQAILIGFHGMSGSKDLFAHTFREEISAVKYNGKTLGEVSIYVNFLREKGIDVKLISGDESIRMELSEAGINTPLFSTNLGNYDSKEEKRTQLLGVMDECLNMDKQQVKVCSCEGEVLVELLFKNWLEYLSPSLFRRNEEMLIFESFSDFMGLLPCLSIFFNGINEVCRFNCKKLKALITKKRITQEEFSFLGLDIYLEKDMRSLSSEDFLEIYRRIDRK